MLSLRAGRRERAGFLRGGAGEREERKNRSCRRCEGSLTYPHDREAAAVMDTKRKISVYFTNWRGIHLPRDLSREMDPISCSKKRGGGKNTFIVSSKLQLDYLCYS